MQYVQAVPRNAFEAAESERLYAPYVPAVYLRLRRGELRGLRCPDANSYAAPR